MAKKMDDKKKEAPRKKDLAETPKAQPGRETLPTSDPQENMEGPISSFMQRTKHIAEKNDEQSKEEATKKRDERMQDC